MDNFLKQNWVLAIISLAVAIAVWSQVSDQTNPIVTQTFSGVVIQSQSAPAGYAVTLSPSEVSVQVQGPESVIGPMTRSDISAQVTIPAQFGKSALTLPIEVATPRGARVNSIVPKTTSVTLQPQTAASLPVALKPVGSVAFGYQMTGLVSAIKSALVSGPAATVKRVAKVEAFVNLDNEQATASTSVQLQPVDQAGGTVSGVTVTPKSVQVTVNVQAVPSKTLPVVVSVLGQPAQGYKLASVTVDPSTVKVYGPKSVLDRLSKVGTGPLSVIGATSPVVRAVNLALPKGTFSSVSEVKVRAVITKPTSGAQTKPSSQAG